MATSLKVHAEASAPQPQPSVGVDLFHLWVVCAFAIAQPVLEKLSRNEPYLVEQRLSLSSLCGTALVVLTIIPMAMCLIELGCWMLAPKVRSRCHVWFMGLLCLLFGSVSARSLVTSFYLETSGLIDFAQFGVACGIGGGLLWAYYRTTWGRSFFSWAGLGLVVFPLTFAFSPAIQSRWSSAQPEDGQIKIANPQPIVIVVFDGLSLNSLLDSQENIDAVRYPHFARLAATSDWFYRATTVHPRTDHAIPAILSGHYPVDGTPPVLDRYPHNLFSELHRSDEYELFVLEPYTRLCPEELQRVKPARTLSEEILDTSQTLGLVYLKIAFPKNISGSMPALPREWFSLPASFQFDQSQTVGLVRYGWDNLREHQVQHFLNGLYAGEKPRLMFAHLAIPHYPFRYLPSGRAYTVDQSATMFPDGTHGDVGEIWGPDELAAQHSWQRYLLQVGYVDHVIGQILDRLEAAGILDETLLIVTSDHGCSFRAGMSQREPDTASLPDLLPIPLFIKRPGQHSGTKSDRNVESIDILPTIADILKCDWPAELDGESVYATTPARQRKTIVMRNPLVLMGDVPQRSEALYRKIRQFGEGPRDERFWSLGPHHELVGRPLSDFPQDMTGTREVTLERWARSDGKDTDVPIVKSLFRGEVTLLPDDQEPVVLAVSLGDRIVGITRSFNDPEYLNRWALLIPEDVVDAHPEPAQIWELRFDADGPRLRSCQLHEFQ